VEILLNDERKCVALSEQAKQDVQGYTWLARAKRILYGFV
jgi:hypothetical protein